MSEDGCDVEDGCDLEDLDNWAQFDTTTQKFASRYLQAHATELTSSRVANWLTLEDRDVHKRTGYDIVAESVYMAETGQYTDAFLSDRLKTRYSSGIKKQEQSLADVLFLTGRCSFIHFGRDNVAQKIHHELNNSLPLVTYRMRVRWRPAPRKTLRELKYSNLRELWVPEDEHTIKNKPMGALSEYHNGQLHWLKDGYGIYYTFGTGRSLLFRQTSKSEHIDAIASYAEQPFVSASPVGIVLDSKGEEGLLLVRSLFADNLPMTHPKVVPFDMKLKAILQLLCFPDAQYAEIALVSPNFIWLWRLSRNSGELDTLHALLSEPLLAWKGAYSQCEALWKQFSEQERPKFKDDEAWREFIAKKSGSEAWRTFIKTKSGNPEFKIALRARDSQLIRKFVNKYVDDNIQVRQRKSMNGDGVSEEYEWVYSSQRQYDIETGYPRFANLFVNPRVLLDTFSNCGGKWKSTTENPYKPPDTWVDHEIYISKIFNILKVDIKTNDVVINKEAWISAVNYIKNTENPEMVEKYLSSISSNTWINYITKWYRPVEQYRPKLSFTNGDKRYKPLSFGWAKVDDKSGYYPLMHETDAYVTNWEHAPRNPCFDEFRSQDGPLVYRKDDADEWAKRGRVYSDGKYYAYIDVVDKQLPDPMTDQVKDWWVYSDPPLAQPMELDSGSDMGSDVDP